MSSQTLGLRFGGTVFGLIAVGQLIRFLTQAEVLIAGRTLPLWVSGVAVVVAGSLSCWLWRLSGCCCAKPPSDAAH